MTVFADAIARGADWLERNIRTGRDVHDADQDDLPGAGWGWIPEVHISALNTAEVVCAFAAVGRSVPQADLVAQCLAEGARRCLASNEFASIHTSWLLRAVTQFPGYEPDPGLADALGEHLATRAIGGGGWAFTHGSETESTFCTANAVVALLCLSHRSEAASAALTSGVQSLLTYLATNERSVLETAYAVRALSREDAAPLLNRRGARLVDGATDWLIEQMKEGVDGVDEEEFMSAGVRGIWRHATLAPAVEAVARRRPDAIFSPYMRRSIRTLVERLQVRDAQRPDFGAFRTSEDGFVTTYSTTLALSALDGVATHAISLASAGELFERLCETDGLDPTDPQTVGQVKGRRLVANFPFALGAATVVLLQSATLIAVAIADTHLAAWLSRVLVIMALLIAFPAIVCAISARFPNSSRSRIGTAVFVALTSAAFPIVAFFIS